MHINIAYHTTVVSPRWTAVWREGPDTWATAMGGSWPIRPRTLSHGAAHSPPRRLAPPPSPQRRRESLYRQVRFNSLYKRVISWFNHDPLFQRQSKLIWKTLKRNVILRGDIWCVRKVYKYLDASWIFYLTLAQNGHWHAPSHFSIICTSGSKNVY